MKRVPIVFAFDNNLSKPAAICLSSLLMSAKADTFYDIFILYSRELKFEEKILKEHFSNFQITYRQVGPDFDNSYEIRGITTTAYYRLLIPELIPEYDIILYSDVDVIFRDDLSDIYFGTDMSGYYVAGVDSLAHLIPDMYKYYTQKRRKDPHGNIYSGNLIFNSRLMRQDGIVDAFRRHIDKKYKFQDMDILNIVCQGRIKYLPPSFCYTTYIADFAVNNRQALLSVWPEDDIQNAQDKGIVHYNGQKPWKGACINFDIWWEFYRKSPFFDSYQYFHFFENMLNELDRLPLLKRVKILARYFFVKK